MDPIQSSPSLRAKSGWRMYHRLRRPLLKIPSSPLISLSRQAIQILADKGGFFIDLFHERKSSGWTKAASGRSRNWEGNRISVPSSPDLNTSLNCSLCNPSPMPITAMKDMWYWSIVNIPLKVYGQPAIIHELGSNPTTVKRICPRPSVAGGRQ